MNENDAFSKLTGNQGVSQCAKGLLDGCNFLEDLIARLPVFYHEDYSDQILQDDLQSMVSLDQFFVLHTSSNGCRVLRDERKTNGRIQVWIGTPAGKVRDGKIGMTIISVQDQSERIFTLISDKQNNHLAAALFGPMMWTCTAEMGNTRNLEVKGLFDL